MKTKLTTIVLALLLSGMTGFAANYYVSPSGNDGNPGSLSNPFASLQKAIGVVQAGDYIYLRGGTYTVSVSSIVITKNGTSGANIHVYAYSGEIPILSFDDIENSSSRGIVMDGDYWYWKGVTIEKAGDNGMLLSGNNNTIENCVFRKNHDTGLQLSRYSSSATSIGDWPSNNLIVGCESFDNKDSGNENADGFAAKLTCGTGNIFRNCVSHHNIDDGWDLYTKSATGPIGEILFENCIAHHNGTLTDGVTSGGGDKNGFKLGSSSNTVDHTLIRCIAFSNGKHGFTDNGNTGNIKFYNLTSYDNGDYNYHTRDNASHTFRNCITFNGNHTDRIVGDAPISCNAFDDTDTDWQIVVSGSDFQTLTPGPDSDPTSNGFLNLASNSPLIDAGCSVPGVSGNGSLDLGAVEYGGVVDPTTTYTLSTSVSGSGTVSGAGTYNEGGTATVTATASVGWSFSNWSGDASGSSNPVSVTMNSDKSITAVFVEDGGNDPVTGDRIEDDDSRLISYDGSLKSYSAADNGYAINLSNSSGKQIVWNYSAASAGSATITLRYTRKASMTPSVDMDINGSVQVVALAETAGSEFATASFNANLIAGTNTITLTTNADGESADIDWIEIAGSGSTTQATYSLTTTINGSGTVSPGSGTYNDGTSVTMTATPASGWQFDSWSGGYTGNPATVVMNTDKNITANFSLITTSQTVVIQENTTGFCGVDGTVDNNNAGFTGDGFANTTNASGNGIDYKVNFSASGTYTFTFNYASTSDRPANLTVNGSTVASNISFPSTGSWTTWTTVSTSVSVSAGTYDVRLEATISDGLANIDYMEITGSTPSASDCEGVVSPVDNSMIGFATVSGDGYITTTGGAGGASTTVSTLAALQAWASNREGNTTPEILYISGKISSSSTTVVNVKHGANVSILGLGSSAELQNVGLNIWDYENVIVRNLKIHEVFYPDDALTIDACNHVWVDHCELHSIIGDGITVDTYDGLLDIKRGSKYVTVSWCYLHDHMKTMLIGHTDNTSLQATDSEMRITLHHNYHQNTDGRNPSLRFGAVHMFNNYFDNISDYGLAARDGGHAKVENCHYNNVKLSMSTDKFPVEGLPNGYICQSGNLFTGSTGAPVISQTGCDWWTSSTLPYSYTLDAVSTVATNVPNNVGVGLVDELKSSQETIPASINSFDVYPNPFNSSATINFSIKTARDLSFKLYDMTGRMVDEISTKHYYAGENKVIYNNPGLKPGIYVLSMQNGTTMENKRLVIE
jgi:pectate lyase